MSLFGTHPYGDTTIGSGGIALGSTGYSLPLFEPEPGPAFTIPLRGRRRIIRHDTGVGMPKTQPLGARARWGIRLTWPGLTWAELCKIYSFFYDLEPNGGPFFYTTPWNVMDPTGSMSKLEGYSSDASSGRTIDVAYTWYSTVTSGESLPSRTGTVILDAPDRVKFTSPMIPPAVDKVRVYAATSGGTLKLQDTITDRVWQEPITGISTGGAVVPTTSTATGFGRYWLVSDEYAISLARPNRWTLQLDFEEDPFPV